MLREATSERERKAGKVCANEEKQGGEKETRGEVQLKREGEGDRRYAPTEPTQEAGRGNAQKETGAESTGAARNNHGAKRP